MEPAPSRRTFLVTTSCTAAAAAGLTTFARVLPARAAETAVPAGPPAPLPPVNDSFPNLDPDLARKAVGFSHGNFSGLKEIIDRYPMVARAAIDWGFGDWESCIGAASHVGNREIADYLISKGARPDIFTFAMLGNLAAVKAMIEAMPGVQRIPGPHGITLLAHARNGGEPARAVLDYLTSLGDADPVPAALPVTDELKQTYIGPYRFGEGDRDVVTIKDSKFGLQIERTGGVARNLIRVAEHEFHPAGAPPIRLRFTVKDGLVSELSFYNPELYLTATRDDC